ncbi:hypothetical protein [Rhodoferax sp. BLA1]|uniref:hypothetical protein n=1 Tax=Rhodoferax sp. BLA1 TaxID=2576062 RepID=UPI0015D3D595|nr:hypothetical protein [Rhodoferax sp. BLA1]
MLKKLVSRGSSLPKNTVSPWGISQFDEQTVNSRSLTLAICCTATKKMPRNLDCGALHLSEVKQVEGYMTLKRKQRL